MDELKCGVYEHYKGGRYLLLGIGEHTETGETVVVYISLTGAHLPGPRLRVRPLAMFTDAVNGQPRFKFIGQDASV
jgi:hypothetical protein